jgi:hypothetical protein
MKTSTNLLIAVAAAIGTGFLLAQDADKKPDPQPQPAPAGNNALPLPPNEPRRPGPGQPRPERPPRPNGALPDDANGPERPFRRPGPPNGPRNPEGGERPPRPNDNPDEFGPDDRPPRPGGRPAPFLNQNVPLKPQAYLGVVTRPVSPELGAQLKQPEGFGLVVEDVLGDSPARTAGVQANDVLRMVDDQLLVNPNQLEALVRRAGKDKEIVLTILREGAEQKLTVKVGEKMLPVRRPLRQQGGFQDGPREFQPRRDGDQPPPNDRPPGGGRDDFRGQPGANAPLDRQTRYAPDRARVVRRDDSGVYEIARIDGHRIFTARHQDGSVAWKGPVDTEEERKAMPEDVARKFEEIEKSRPLDRVGDKAPLPRPEGSS